jgi:drug/metabolite transporter (DMT)-like permease
MPSRPSWKQDAILLATVLIWGINIPILKGALAAMHPHVLNVFRFTVSTAVLGGLYVVRRRGSSEGFFAPLRLYGRQIALLGLLGYLFYQFCFIVGIDYTTAGNAALIMASAPLWTALIGHVLGYDVLGRSGWLGLAATLAGTALIVIAGAQDVSLGSDTFIGNAIMLLGAMLWGTYTALTKPVLRNVSPVGLSFLGLLFALPFLVGLAVPYAGSVDWSRVDLGVWAAILFSGGLSTGLAVALWNGAVRAVGPSYTAVFGNLVPLVALLGSVVLLGERITLAQVAGGALILGGLLLMRRHRRQVALR